jgi:hypothetical protein
MLANTHPFNPVFSIPVALKELAEVASLFSFAARSFASGAGGLYLNYRFGWKAFYNDVQTLAKITEEIEQRMRDFNYMLEKGHTRKRYTFPTMAWDYTQTNVSFNSAYGTSVRGNIINSTTIKRWGSVTWGLMGDKTIPTDELSQFNRAVRTAFDLESLDPATLWELIPFSWLADYFLNMGDFLKSQHMRYEVQPYDVCIMRNHIRIARTRVTSKPVNVVIDQEGFYKLEIKSRDWVQPPVSPPLSFDLVRGDRWKVILALAAKFYG